MPRAALISWDHKEGLIILSCGPNIFKVPHSSDDPFKNAETYTRLCKYLQALSPILPPEQPEYTKGDALPEVTEAQLSRAQKFSLATPAKGSGVKTSRVSNEELMDLILGPGKTE